MDFHMKPDLDLHLLLQTCSAHWFRPSFVLEVGHASMLLCSGLYRASVAGHQAQSTFSIDMLTLKSPQNIDTVLEHQLTSRVQDLKTQWISLEDGTYLPPATQLWGRRGVWFILRRLRSYSTWTMLFQLIYREWRRPHFQFCSSDRCWCFTWRRRRGLGMRFTNHDAKSGRMVKSVKIYLRDHESPPLHAPIRSPTSMMYGDEYCSAD